MEHANDPDSKMTKLERKTSEIVNSSHLNCFRFIVWLKDRK